MDSERKYVDLIYAACRKYASWDPEIVVRVGDFGRITKGRVGLAFWRRKKGIFLKHGNIYEDGRAEKFGIPRPREYGVEATEGNTWIVSKNAKEAEISVAAGSGTPILAQCKIKNAFNFVSGCGALLAMENDSISVTDNPGSFVNLLEDETMHGMVIVSEVHSCSSYARLLTSYKGGHVAIGLAVEPPVPGAGNVTGDIHWVRSNHTGNFKSKSNRNGKRTFYPLYRLLAISDKGPTTGIRGGGELPDAEPPWMKLSH